MREFNALKGYPEPKNVRYVSPNLRTIKSRIIASYRGEEYYDGDRNNGYGGFHYDGRWAPIAKNMCEEYSLDGSSAVLQLNPEKGFLLHDFYQIYPTMKLSGVEISDYAMEHAMLSVKPFIQKGLFTKLPFADNTFDFVIAIGVIYPLTLADAIKCLKEIQRVSKGKSFITLAAYRTEEEFLLFRSWTVLGSTILHEDDWIEVMKHAGYTGDYKFNTARSLNLIEKKD